MNCRCLNQRILVSHYAGAPAQHSLSNGSISRCQASPLSSGRSKPGRHRPCFPPAPPPPPRSSRGPGRPARARRPRGAAARARRRPPGWPPPRAPGSAAPAPGRGRHAGEAEAGGFVPRNGTTPLASLLKRPEEGDLLQERHPHVRSFDTSTHRWPACASPLPVQKTKSTANALSTCPAGSAVHGQF